MGLFLAGIRTHLQVFIHLLAGLAEAVQADAAPWDLAHAKVGSLVSSKIQVSERIQDGSNFWKAHDGRRNGLLGGLHNCLCLFRLYDNYARINSSMETGKNKTSEKSEPKLGLPKKASCIVSFSTSAFLAVCLSSAAGKGGRRIKVRRNRIKATSLLLQQFNDVLEPFCGLSVITDHNVNACSNVVLEPGVPSLCFILEQQLSKRS